MKVPGSFFHRGNGRTFQESSESKHSHILQSFHKCLCPGWSQCHHKCRSLRPDIAGCLHCEGSRKFLPSGPWKNFPRKVLKVSTYVGCSVVMNACALDGHCATSDRTDGKAEDAGSGAATGADGESGTGDAGAERSARPYGRGCG